MLLLLLLLGLAAGVQEDLRHQDRTGDSTLLAHWGERLALLGQGLLQSKQVWKVGLLRGLDLLDSWSGQERKGAGGRGRKGEATAAVIHLQGVGVSYSWLCRNSLGLALGLDNQTIWRCPRGDIRPLAIYPHTYLPGLAPLVGIRSWFNFWLMPWASVLSPVAGESRRDLEAAMARVEHVIRQLEEEEGVPSRNIVLTGTSQGGAVALYMAVHSQYKLGAILPMVTWMPR